MAAVAAHAEAQWRDEHGDPPDDETRTEGPVDPDPTDDGDGDGPSHRELNPSVPDATGDAVDPEPFHPRPARLADGLVGLARTGLTEGPTPVTDGEPAELVLRVDRAFLAGETDTGICQADFGPTLPRSSARRLACDCRITTMVHDALGRPLGIGRTSRNVPRWLRRALKDRDGGCVFPGCSHTAYTEAHHIWHWANGGPTDLSNLVLVCVKHHKAIHDHHLKVILHDSGRVEVQRADGTPIMRPPRTRLPRPHAPPPHQPRQRPPRPRRRRPPLVARPHPHRPRLHQESHRPTGLTTPCAPDAPPPPTPRRGPTRVTGQIGRRCRRPVTPLTRGRDPRLPLGLERPARRPRR